MNRRLQELCDSEDRVLDKMLENMMNCVLAVGLVIQEVKEQVERNRKNGHKNIQMTPLQESTYENLRVLVARYDERLAWRDAVRERNT